MTLGTLSASYGAGGSEIGPAIAAYPRHYHVVIDSTDACTTLIVAGAQPRGG